MLDVIKYSSMTALITLACTYNSFGISSKMRWVPGGALIPDVLAPGRGHCCSDHTLRSKDLSTTQRGSHLRLSGPQVHLGSPGQNGDLLQCYLPTQAHPRAKGALHE